MTAVVHNVIGSRIHHVSNEAQPIESIKVNFVPTTAPP